MSSWMRLLAFCNLQQRNRWFEPKPLHFRWILLLDQIPPVCGDACSACAWHKWVAGRPADPSDSSRAGVWCLAGRGTMSSSLGDVSFLFARHCSAALLCPEQSQPCQTICSRFWQPICSVSFLALVWAAFVAGLWSVIFSTSVWLHSVPWIPSVGLSKRN